MLDLLEMKLEEENDDSTVDSFRKDKECGKSFTKEDVMNGDANEAIDKIEIKVEDKNDDCNYYSLANKSTVDSFRKNAKRGKSFTKEDFVNNDDDDVSDEIEIKLEEESDDLDYVSLASNSSKDFFRKDEECGKSFTKEDLVSNDDDDASDKIEIKVEDIIGEFDVPSLSSDNHITDSIDKPLSGEQILTNNGSNTQNILVEIKVEEPIGLFGTNVNNGEEKSYTSSIGFECQVCGRAFLSLHALKIHSRIHLQEKPDASLKRL